MSVLGKPVVRAAVYTRKSYDEGLDQVFGGKSTTTMIAQISKLTDLGFRKTPSN